MDNPWYCVYHHSCPISGTYRVSGSFHIATAQTTGDDIYIGFAINGSLVFQYRAPFNINDTLGTHLHATTLVQGKAGDNIALFEQHGTAGSKTLANSSSAQACFSIERIGNY